MTSPAETLHFELLTIVNEIMDDADLSLVAEFDPALRLREDLGFDSLKLAILTVRLEDRFHVDVFSRGLVATLGQVAARLSKQAE
jgi:acyl carrier protein